MLPDRFKRAAVRALKKRNMKRIYTLYSPQYPYRYKIGITERNVSDRVFEIKKSIKDDTGNDVQVKCFFSVPSLFAYRTEQFLHRKFARFSAKMPGSGKTEWFMWGNVALALLFLLVTQVYTKISPAWCVVVAIAPIPLDFAALLFLSVLIESTAILLAIVSFFVGLAWIFNSLC